MAILQGNLAPLGTVIKHSAAWPHLLRHTGCAVVFDSIEDLTSRIDDPDLDVTADDILVLRSAGTKGAPGMPEAGFLLIPIKLAPRRQRHGAHLGRRMSGTAFGTIVLHIAPESAAGGLLSIVRNGDEIPLIRYEQQQGIGFAVCKYVLQKRGAIAHDCQRAPGTSLTAIAKSEVDYLLGRLARQDPRAKTPSRT
jgi:dihydroxyacid dehydratase/phosphogluconate dehydratase